MILLIYHGAQTTIIDLPDFAGIDQALAILAQSLEDSRRKYQLGVITEYELAWRSAQDLDSAIATLSRILAATAGLVPDHPWPLGTQVSVPRQGTGIVLTDDGATCLIRIVHDVLRVPAAQCEWDWHPTPTSVALAEEKVTDHGNS